VVRGRRACGRQRAAAFDGYRYQLGEAEACSRLAPAVTDAADAACWRARHLVRPSPTAAEQPTLMLAQVMSATTHTHHRHRAVVACRARVSLSRVRCTTRKRRLGNHTRDASSGDASG